jgi:hemerythrin-like domain-containing protein
MSEAASRAAAGDRTALEAFAEAAGNFEVLLRSHIQRENGVLFRIAERVLDPAVQSRLAEQFQALAAARPAAELSRRAETLAREIADSCPTCGSDRPQD